MNSWLPFLTGLCVGFVVTGTAADVAKWFAARKAKHEAIDRTVKLERLAAAMEREMTTVVDGLLESARRAATGEPTPGCDCPPCKAKRLIAQKGTN